MKKCQLIAKGIADGVQYMTYQETHNNSSRFESFKYHGIYSYMFVCTIQVTWV